MVKNTMKSEIIFEINIFLDMFGLWVVYGDRHGFVLPFGNVRTDMLLGYDESVER